MSFMKLFFCDYAGKKFHDYWEVETDDQGDFIRLGLKKSQLDELILKKDLKQTCNFWYEKVDEAERYCTKLYLSELLSPGIINGNQIHSGFPYKDMYLNEDDEIEEEWELLDLENQDYQHPYSKLYQKQHPNVLIGIVEVISINEPSLIDDLYRCRLVGFDYFRIPKNENMDEVEHFISRHLVVLRPKECINFHASFIKDGEKHYYTNISISYEEILAELSL